jgi:hypothetical protein
MMEISKDSLLPQVNEAYSRIGLLRSYGEITVVLDYYEAILLYNIIITYEGGPYRGGPIGGGTQIDDKNKTRGDLIKDFTEKLLTACVQTAIRF